MDMQNFDPKVAARVWQRVQASREKKCEEKPACPLEGICTVPAMPVVPEVRKPCKQVQRNENCGEFLLWLIILLLCM